MPANYDRTAWFYDALARLVFGNSLRKAQITLLRFIPENASVLIAGGGTGWILDELTKIHPSGLTITYVEISEKMTALSRKRNTGINQVKFVVLPVEEVQFDEPFDVIITPFLFDNFDEYEARAVFRRLHQSLKPGGLWLFSDFQLAGKWWHPLLLKAMYVFFKLFKAVHVSRPPDVERLLAAAGYEQLFCQTFYGDFVISKTWRK